MKYEEIPFMHWGIINKYNFSDDKIDRVPVKVFDPLLTHRYSIYGTTGHFSYISPVRGYRPKGVDFEKRKRSDVFRKIIEGQDWAIYITLDDNLKSSPFEKTPYMFCSEKYRAATIINRFPSYVRIIDDEVLERIKRIDDKIAGSISRGINLVTFPIKYCESVSEIDSDDLFWIIKSMNAAISYSIKEANRIGYGRIVVYPFFNIGPLAGGSQPRLHSQVYMDLNSDGHGLLMDIALTVFRSGGEQCPLCEDLEEDVIIYQNDTWTLWAARAPKRNFQLRFAPKRHVEYITDLSLKEIRGLADILIRSNKALDALGVNENRNIIFYTKPIGYGFNFHLFGEILPWENIGGVELLDTCRVVRVSPRSVASMVREQIGKETKL